VKPTACLLVFALALGASQQGTHTETGQDAKPACKAGNNGEFWPREANGNHAAFQQFYQSGELQMCTLVVWKYKWQYLSVNIHDKDHTRHSAARNKANSAGGAGGS
jgi:hypothetical protein